MKLFGYTILEKHQPEVEDVNKSFYERINTMLKPLQSEIPPFNNQMAPPTKIDGRLLKEFAYSSDTYRTIMNALKQETFRKGLEINKTFECKCSNPKCKATYDFVTDNCEICGSTTYKPDLIQRERLENLILSCNEHNGLQKELEQIEEDFEIHDNAYLVLVKQYFIENKEIKSANIEEIRRGDPVFMRKLITNTGEMGYTGNRKVYVCPIHRNTPYYTSGYCSECGTKLYRSDFAQVNYTNTLNQGSFTYYLKGEVLHSTKYTSTKGYGVSPVLTLFNKVNTLIQQDLYNMKLYSDTKPPKSLLFIKTANSESLFKMWNTMIEKITAKPHMLYPIAVETNGETIKGQIAEYIDLMRSNTEMQFIEQREEYRKVIGAFFGVSPIFQNDTSASGGLNNERLQIVVTNRAIERTQAVLNEMLVRMINEFGTDGWKIELVESEDRNEMNDLLIEKQRIENAVLMKQLGYKVYLDEKGEFQYEYDENLNYANALSQVQYEQPTNNIKVGMDNEPITKGFRKKYKN